MSDPSAIAATNASIPTPAPSRAQAPGTDKSALGKAARQFEAIFVRQMMASARKTHFDDGLFSNQAMDTFREQQDSHFADVAAEKDSFGLAKMIETRLNHQSAAPAAAGAAKSGAKP